MFNWGESRRLSVAVDATEAKPEAETAEVIFEAPPELEDSVHFGQLR